MDNTPRQRTYGKYRGRLGERGLVRFELVGRDADRVLLRTLTQRLAEDGPEAAALRATVVGALSAEPSRKGSIVAALRRSPLVGSDLNLTRLSCADREIDL